MVTEMGKSLIEEGIERGKRENAIEVNMNIYKEMIESMDRITYAQLKQKDGNLSYLSVEMGNRDFVSSIWNAIEKGIREEHIRISERCKEIDIEFPNCTDEEVKNMARETIVQGCYKEGCSKDYLKRAFRLSDDILEQILNSKYI
ncbi:hypothetical protein [Romboutsia sp.]|uniref:hypothetical protein n=1 Tax=Romboutsia sp. TaxID=1965302 RepID=UPI003F3E5D9B